MSFSVRIATICAVSLLLAAAVGQAVPSALAATTKKADKTAPATKKKATKTRPNWLVNCANTGANGALNCRMTQTLFVAKTRKRLLQVTVNAPAATAGSKPTLLIMLPHGLYLPAGIALKVDTEKEKKLVIQTADANGSYAGLALEESLLSKLQKGTKLTVSMVSSKKQRLNIPVSLAGFSSSYKRLTTLK